MFINVGIFHGSIFGFLVIILDLLQSNSINLMKMNRIKVLN